MLSSVLGQQRSSAAWALGNKKRHCNSLLVCTLSDEVIPETFRCTKTVRLFTKLYKNWGVSTHPHIQGSEVLSWLASITCPSVFKRLRHHRSKRYQNWYSALDLGEGYSEHCYIRKCYWQSSTSFSCGLPQVKIFTIPCMKITLDIQSVKFADSPVKNWF